MRTARQRPGDGDNGTSRGECTSIDLNIRRALPRAVTHMRGRRRRAMRSRPPKRQIAYRRFSCKRGSAPRAHDRCVRE
ncbi:hypothetical protein EVAR_73495_1 [Eumeta japonica]|uniref:Uncharacterized protein n=1 Tax=Eumeta variegata TaxID=151549 RepID=A0A4C1SWI7_EUMVA|nr:hypothetical protein EVAR_73495_1 [Eumeta japonica]